MPDNDPQILGMIQAYYLKWLNFDPHRLEEPFTIDSFWPAECQIISRLHVGWGFESLEVVNCFLGMGDEGGPALLTVHLDTRDDKEPRIIFIAQHFDTASREIYRENYMDNKPIWT
jgi:hypothetical protein